MEKNWKFYGVGVIVRDIDKAIEHYKSLGIATTVSEVTEVTLDKGAYPDLKMYGKPFDAQTKLKVGTVQIGSISLVLVQPVEGESAHKEFLDSKGEGIQFITFIVDDFDKEVAELVGKGVPVVISGKSSTGEGFAHFDIRKGGNVIIELYHPAE